MEAWDDVEFILYHPSILSTRPLPLALPSTSPAGGRWRHLEARPWRVDGGVDSTRGSKAPTHASPNACHTSSWQVDIGGFYRGKANAVYTGDLQSAWCARVSEL